MITVCVESKWVGEAAACALPDTVNGRDLDSALGDGAVVY